MKWLANGILLWLSLTYCKVLTAQPFVPAGLSPGDTYQLIFVTSQDHGVTSSPIFPPVSVRKPGHPPFAKRDE